MKYAICIENEGVEDLEILKVYRVLPDKAAAAERTVRVIDESGEDYLYPEQFFVFVALPAKVRRVVSTALSGRRGAPRGDLLELGAPLRRKRGVARPSESLRRARARER